MNDGGTPVNLLVDSKQQYAQVVAEYDSLNTQTVEYVFGVNRISQLQSGVNKYYLADGQGSIRDLVDEYGQVTDEMGYTGFGEKMYRAGSTQNRFGYVGEEYYGSIQKIYLRTRWLDPKIGRFLSADLYKGCRESPVSTNKYLYGNSSPINYTDPDGRFSFVETVVTGVIDAIVVAGAIAYYQIQTEKILKTDPNRDDCGSKGSEWVPDIFWPFYNFSGSNGPCANHDKCYGTCGGPSKTECDQIFYAEMVKTNPRSWAKVVPYIYYHFVSAYGGDAFQEARKACP
jgi:RHS repeat-associated protein